MPIRWAGAAALRLLVTVGLGAESAAGAVPASRPRSPGACSPARLGPAHNPRLGSGLALAQYACHRSLLDRLGRRVPPVLGLL